MLAIFIRRRECRANDRVLIRSCRLRVSRKKVCAVSPLFEYIVSVSISQRSEASTTPVPQHPESPTSISFPSTIIIMQRRIRFQRHLYIGCYLRTLCLCLGLVLIFLNLRYRLISGNCSYITTPSRKIETDLINDDPGLSL